MGFGFVLRTDSGRVVLAGSTRIKGAGNNTLLEALALRYGLRSFMNHGLHCSQAETDSRNIVLALHRESEVDTVSEMIAKDVQVLAQRRKPGGTYACPLRYL
ncbi:hypothetical protein ACS0TY_017454 [Phlomoides rotata]